jgi:hypothetical protein
MEQELRQFREELQAAREGLQSSRRPVIRLLTDVNGNSGIEIGSVGAMKTREGQW